MNKESENLPFINYLYSLVEKGQRGTLADLRKGLSGAPGTVPVMYQYIVPWIPEEDRNTWKEKVYYILASLFAHYQSGGASKALATQNGNFGDHCRALQAKKNQSDSFEQRFSNLLKAHRDDLPIFLRQTLSQLRGEDIPINWNKLFKDLIFWSSLNQTVQRQWANSYWRYQKTEETIEK
ncbi:MAG: type I-E CRISPR-associated protein Cse2/CasB [Anaerolineaceae bacterium]|nr:type I-E CRISPR-associated protein Cse2/CasB [Anaerolineaceae bacterium]